MRLLVVLASLCLLVAGAPRSVRQVDNTDSTPATETIGTDKPIVGEATFTGPSETDSSVSVITGMVTESTPASVETNSTVAESTGRAAESTPSILKASTVSDTSDVVVTESSLTSTDGTSIGVEATSTAPETPSVGNESISTDAVAGEGTTSKGPEVVAIGDKVDSPAVDTASTEGSGETATSPDDGSSTEPTTNDPNGATRLGVASALVLPLGAMLLLL
ncbi:hypothetical protein AAVH_13378 [Aphelenchoides avenae]|nr:hypothetical protein AAVH_13378 [Aphelenchus avenae]